MRRGAMRSLGMIGRFSFFFWWWLVGGCCGDGLARVLLVLLGLDVVVPWKWSYTASGDYSAEANMNHRGRQYGGVIGREDCDSLPENLQGGCYWRWNWANGEINGWNVTYNQISCPAALTSVSGCSN